MGHGLGFAGGFNAFGCLPQSGLGLVVDAITVSFGLGDLVLGLIDDAGGAG
ncbi:hypothetical protein [Nocardia terpenica]|uniref:hypothetical protein n=1 Tax=Nocardia terpenica TaxID=455432 RepID=UPI0012FD1183|nr:hypothetical protein [Nocardia terpenica]